MTSSLDTFSEHFNFGEEVILLDADLASEPSDSELFNQYRSVISAAIDETLETILGTTIKEVIYDYVRHQHNLDAETCHKDPDEFMKALREMIGENATMIIENIVIKKICSSLSLKEPTETSHLSDLIERLKSVKYESSARIGNGV